MTPTGQKVGVRLKFRGWYSRVRLQILSPAIKKETKTSSQNKKKRCYITIKNNRDKERLLDKRLLLVNC